MTEEIMSSNVKIIRDSNPYVMDKLVDYNNIAALTRKNADFIEAIIRLDSNYKKESENKEPDNGFDLEKHSSKAEGLYCGSTKYWFEEMKNDSSKYQDCIWGAVVSIDRSNSTHLETTLNGRYEMAKRIFEKCPNLESLKSELSKEFFSRDDDHLIAVMLKEGLKSIKDDKDMYYLSFASKFCSCAAECLGTNPKYSKYDGVVSAALPEYYKAYCGEDKKKCEFKVNYNASDKYRNRLKVYEEDSNAISEILESIDEDNTLTRDEFDHIIWYGMKGN